MLGRLCGCAVEVLQVEDRECVNPMRKTHRLQALRSANIFIVCEQRRKIFWSTSSDSNTCSTGQRQGLEYLSFHERKRKRRGFFRPDFRIVHNIGGLIVASRKGRSRIQKTSKLEQPT